MLNKKLEIVLFEVSTIMYILFSDDPIMINWTKFFLLAFFAIEILQISSKRGIVHFGSGIKIATFFTLYCACSLIWSVDYKVAEGAFITQVQIYLLFVFVYWFFSHEGEIAYYLHAQFVAGIALAIYAVYAYGGPLAYVTKMISGARMGGLIQNENAFGVNFTYACFAALVLSIKKDKGSYLIFAIVFALFALSSGSKKAMVLVIISFIGVLTVKYGVKRVYKMVIPILVLVVAGYVVLQSSAFSGIAYRLSAYANGSSISDNARSTMRAFGYSMVIEKPVLGWGLRNYQVFYPTGQYSHDNFVEVAVSLGIVGLVSYYMMYAVPLTRSMKLLVSRKLPLPIEYKALLILALADLVFGYGMVQLYVRNSWILLAVLCASYEKMRTYERQGEVLVRMNRFGL